MISLPVPLIANYLSVTTYVEVSNLRICVYGLSPGNRNKRPEYQKSKLMNDICLCYQVLSAAAIYRVKLVLIRT